MKKMVLDVGGTAIKSGIFEEGALSCLQETPTPASQGGPQVVRRVIQIISDYQKDHSFDEIGISTAGQVNPYEGRIIYANENIPGYTGTPLRAILEEQFRLPVYIENDVNCAALGEAFFGAGQGEDSFACLTYGTGVGGALYLNGDIFRGSTCSAGEFGATVVHPEDRRLWEDAYSGCYEKYASTTALVAMAQAKDPSLDSGRKIFARRDDPVVEAVLRQWIREIVYGLTSIVHMLNPSCIILGGGVMEQPGLPEQIQEQLYQSIMPSYRHVKIRKARLGNQAGMLGAAALSTVLPLRT